MVHGNLAISLLTSPHDHVTYPLILIIPTLTIKEHTNVCTIFCLVIVTIADSKHILVDALMSPQQNEYLDEQHF